MPKLPRPFPQQQIRTKKSRMISELSFPQPPKIPFEPFPQQQNRIIKIQIQLFPKFIACYLLNEIYILIYAGGFFKNTFFENKQRVWTNFGTSGRGLLFIKA